MISICLTLIGLIGITIIADAQSSTEKQTEAIPVRVTDK